MGLFFLYFFEDFCEKYRHYSNHHKEYELANCREKYCRYTKYDREKIDNESDLSLLESKLQESIMEMVCLVSLHRILSFEEPCSDDIDKVDQIESEDRYGCGDLATSDDRQSRYEESEHDRP